MQVGAATEGSEPQQHATPARFVLSRGISSCAGVRASSAALAVGKEGTATYPTEWRAGHVVPAHHVGSCVRACPNRQRPRQRPCDTRDPRWTVAPARRRGGRDGALGGAANRATADCAPASRWLDGTTVTSRIVARLNANNTHTHPYAHQLRNLTFPPFTSCLSLCQTTDKYNYTQCLLQERVITKIPTERRQFYATNL